MQLGVCSSLNEKYLLQFHSYILAPHLVALFVNVIEPLGHKVFLEKCILGAKVVVLVPVVVVMVLLVAVDVVMVGSGVDGGVVLLLLVVVVWWWQ